MEGKPTAYEQLIHMMELIKEQYLRLVSNPNLAHLNAANKGGRNTEGFLRFVLGRRTSANTNIGRVEDVIKTDPEVVKPLSLAIGHRLSWKQPDYHIWTINSIMHLQVQVTDVWDELTMKRHMADVKNIMLAFIQ